MSVQHFDNIKIKGICTSVPAMYRLIEDEYNYFGEDYVKRVSKTTGVVKRHLASSSMCASDLAYASIKSLLQEISWDPDSIDCMILVTQTPDYLLPNTGSILHYRLGLKKNAIVLDVNLGCSGYIYGLWLISNLLSNGFVKRGLLIVADTISKVVNNANPALRLLFGDAASATALEYDRDGDSMNFLLGIDGSKFDALIVPNGLFRLLDTNQDIGVENKKNFTGDNQEKILHIDGPDMMNFILEKVPEAIRKILVDTSTNVESVDYWVMHQANDCVLKNLARKLDVSINKFLFSLEEFGNTSSASIPLTITNKLNSLSKKNNLTFLMAGFGVGLSWGAALIRSSNMVIPEIMYVE